jgi:hypothetical protein
MKLISLTVLIALNIFTSYAIEFECEMKMFGYTCDVKDVEIVGKGENEISLKHKENESFIADVKIIILSNTTSIDFPQEFFNEFENLKISI